MKRTKTLSYKLSLIFIGGMSFAMLAGGVTTYVVQNRIIKNFTNSRLKSSVFELSKQTDEDLIRVETIVKSTSFIVSNYFNETADLEKPTYVNSALVEIQNSTGLHELPAKEYEDVCAHYVVLNPEYTGLAEDAPAGDGFFHVKNSDGVFEDHIVTNVLQYEETDMAHAGWWYQAKNAGEPIWLEPYHNANINQNIFSYVVPFYSNEENKKLLGVIGLDIDLKLVIKDIVNTGEYKDANTYLSTKEGNIVYHEDVETIKDGIYKVSDKTLKDLSGVEDFKQSQDGAITYKYKNHNRTTMSTTLTNGLTYGVSVRTGELRKPIRLVIIIPSLVYFGILVLMVFVFYLLLKRYVKPLQDLHTAVDKVRKGDYKFEVTYDKDDEIGDLTNSFSVMVKALAEKNKMITAMAFTDGLTGVKNSNAYRDIEKRLDAQIKDKTAKFALIMLDVDKLKMINDNLGHESGDRAIIGSCYSLCKGFSHSPVFRVGGDEFVAIAEGDDYEKRYEIYEKLRNNLISVKNTKYEFSVGMATYEPGVDHSFKDVFARADQEMYLNKKAKRRYEQD